MHGMRPASLHHATFTIGGLIDEDGGCVRACLSPLSPVLQRLLLFLQLIFNLAVYDTHKFHEYCLYDRAVMTSPTSAFTHDRACKYAIAATIAKL